MKAEIITIGDEILIGQIIDTNSAWLAEQLNLIGFSVYQIISISDREDHIVEALINAQKNADLVIITGGLGPTSDDITKNTLAEFFHTKLERNEQVYADIKDLFEKRGLNLTSRNEQQADVPLNCTVIRNSNGTAPGMWFDDNGVVFISMPGVPFEMTEMAETKVFPLLKEKFKLPTILHKTISTFGMPESFLAETIQPWEEKLPETIKLAYLPSPERVRLRMSVESSGSKITEKTLNNEIDKLKKIIGQTIFATEDELLENTIGKLLKEKAQTLATAESCTGGNIAKLITSVSGCSDYYEGSVIAYSNRIKTKILGVKTETLEKFGAVSKETVEEMALGVMKLYDSDFAIAVSGIAGPNGGTENKPVGTTWIAVASKNNIISKNFSFGTKRELNIRRASSKALDMLRLMLLK